MFSIEEINTELPAFDYAKQDQSAGKDITEVCGLCPFSMKTQTASIDYFLF